MAYTYEIWDEWYKYVRIVPLIGCARTLYPPSPLVRLSNPFIHPVDRVLPRQTIPHRDAKRAYGSLYKVIGKDRQQAMGNRKIQNKAPCILLLKGPTK